MSHGSIQRQDDEHPDCVRCIAPTPSTRQVRFTFRGRAYEIDLCGNHVEMIERDFAAWTRVARELTMERAADPRAPRSPFPPIGPGLGSQARSEPTEAARRMKVPVLEARGEVIDHDKAEPDVVPWPQPGTAFPAPGGSTDPLDDWAFTDHALDRMRERHISSAAVWATLRSPDSEVTPAKDSKWRYISDRATVVVDQVEQVIVTVGYPRAHPLFSSSATD
jgi:hypothetical protein